MLTVTELANRSGVTPTVVRYYTRVGLLSPERHPENDYRLYRPTDAQRLRFIRQAKSLGFTLKEIREILARVEAGQSPCPLVRDRLRSHIEENRRRIEALQRQQAHMEAALAEWERLPDSLPDAQVLCPLIETSGDPDVLPGQDH